MGQAKLVRDELPDPMWYAVDVASTRLNRVRSIAGKAITMDVNRRILGFAECGSQNMAMFPQPVPIIYSPIVSVVLQIS